jgi:hypothetical protein
VGSRAKVGTPDSYNEMMAIFFKLDDRLFDNNKERLRRSADGFAAADFKCLELQEID